MPGHPRLKMIMKGIDPVTGKVKKLIGKYDLSPRYFFLKAAAGSGGQYRCTTKFLKRKNIRAVVYVRGSDGMIPGMPRKDKYFIISQFAA